MEPERESLSQQVAVSSLLAFVAFALLSLSRQLAGLEAAPVELVPIFNAVLTLAVLFFPLVWWRRAAGYIGAMGVGVFALIVELGFGIPGTLRGERSILILPGEIVLALIAVLIVVSSAAAWREKP